MDAEGHAGLAAAGYRSQRHAVPRRVYARLGQQPAQGGVGPGRRSDTQTLDRCNIARLNPQVGTQHQHPEGMPGQGGQQLGSLPVGEGRQGSVGRTGHEVDAAVPQRFHGPAHREDHLQLHVHSLGLEIPQLHGGHRREVGVGHQVGYCDAH